MISLTGSWIEHLNQVMAVLRTKYWCFLYFFVIFVDFCGFSRSTVRVAICPVLFPRHLFSRLVLKLTLLTLWAQKDKDVPSVLASGCVGLPQLAADAEL